MMWRTWSLGRIRGVAVMVDASALFLVLYLSLRSLDQYSDFFEGSRLASLVLIIVVGYLLSILLHEVGHVAAGRVFGIRSRSIVLHGFGGAAFLDEIPDTPLKQGVIAAAGPVTNLLVWQVLEPMAESRISTGPGTVSTIWLGLAIVASANLWFGLFNLIPAPPLDGGSIMEALIWQSTRDRGDAYRHAGTVGLGALGVVALLAANKVYPFQFGILIFLGFICVPVCLARRSEGGGSIPTPTISSDAGRARKKAPAPQADEIQLLELRATSQAREFGNEEVTASHVLLALANARYGQVGLLLASFGTNYSELWDAARAEATMVTAIRPPGLSREAKRILDRAKKSGLGAPGAFLEFASGDTAGQLLAKAGVDLRQAQEELRATLR